MLGLDTNADVIIPNKTNAAVTNTATPKWAAARVQPGTPPSSSSSSAQPAKTAKGGTAAGASAGTAGNALSSSSTPATPSRVKTAAVAGSGSSSANTGGTGGGGNAEDGKGSAWGAFATSLLYQGLKLTATAVTVCVIWVFGWVWVGVGGCFGCICVHATPHNTIAYTPSQHHCVHPHNTFAIEQLYCCEYTLTRLANLYTQTSTSKPQHQHIQTHPTCTTRAQLPPHTHRLLLIWQSK